MQTFRRLAARVVWLAVVFLATSPLAWGQSQISVPIGGEWRIGTGALIAGGSDVRVAGRLKVGSGHIDGVRHFDVQPGGAVDNGNGRIRVAGDWRNLGNYSSGTGGVEFVDGLGLASASIVGNSDFFNVSFLSALGKRYLFAASSVQSITGLLGIHGLPGIPIQFASSIPGQVASINLLPNGSQSIDHVGVTDVHAIGQALAPNLSNEGGGGNAQGWFGALPYQIPTPVPALSHGSFVLLCLLIGAAVRRRLATSPSFGAGS